MKVAELSGAELDYWVAKANGEEAALLNNGRGGQCVIKTCGAYEPYSPSRAWSQGGPILEMEHMLVEPPLRGDSSPWDARTQDGDWVSGETLLTAAMRCYVATKFGDEVPDAE